MKFTLTITEATQAEILKFLSMSSAASANIQMTPQTEDDEGPTNVAAPAVDSTGLPWDERIHAASKALTGTGSWRKKRGADESYIATVEAELRARAPQMPTPAVPSPALSAPVPPQMPQIPPVPPAGPVHSAEAIMGAPVPPQMPPMPPVPPPAPPAPAAPAAPSNSPRPEDFNVTFNDFMQIVSNRMQQDGADGQKIITPAYLQELNVMYQISSIADLAAKVDFIPYVITKIRSDGKWVN